MKKLIFYLILFGTFSSCVTTQTQVPVMPLFTTPEGKACARNCQSIYAQCNMACSQMIGGARTASQREQCLNNCNKTLEDCYKTCE